ncbi:chemotaxis protein CheW [Desulfovibrio aerotolerans]|uniref:Chemotaxis protein CheW n=1 Tax=Solidesulfovibrio aerotolerans TaxID=295255 RepID=A0A7C9ILI3_9BACT|nr:chemotaxis protein CheW [Solidesulfovibrio aerotolerans]
MSPSLEQYFEERVLLPEQGGTAFSDAERAFLARYMGEDFEAALDRQGLSRPAVVESITGELAPARGPDRAAGPGADPDADPDDDAALEARLCEAREVKLVGFRVAGQELAVPIAQVQEVIRAMPLTRLPAAPPHIAGVTNLRGRVAPMVDLAKIMDFSSPSGENRFIIVCRGRGMLVGLLVEAIAAMHQAAGQDIEWGVEARVGVASDLVSGLLKVGDGLVKILSVDSLFQKVLKS